MPIQKDSPNQDLLEKKFGLRFKDPRLLELALTHKSHAIENGSGAFNERLEFLGDSILNAAVTDFLYGRYPKEDEGKLSKLKSLLVSRSSLVDWAREIEIGQFLRLSASEEMTGGRDRDSLIANAMEALIGAIYLDRGYDEARRFVLEKFNKKKRIVERDYKSKLQELIQKKYKIPPSYSVTGESGPDHDKTFTMEVRIKKKFLGKGSGKSKKEAEQEAARSALKQLRQAKKAG